MTVLAISTGSAILAWIGLALGLVVLAVVVGLLNRVVRPALEIRRYADHVLEAGLSIGRNVEGAEKLLRTRELATAVPELALAYLRKVEEGR